MLQTSKDAGNKFAKRAITVLGIFIFSYTLVRAYLLSITWDESYTFTEYIKNGIILQDRMDGMSANNHLLNTLGGIFFTNLFGVSEFTLRISSLIAHLLFIIYSAKFVLRTGNKWLSISAFIVLNFNPFMLDFFSLSRGYSISLGCMMGSLYYFYLFHINGLKKREAVLSLLFGITGTFGNLTLLNYTIVLFGLIILLIIWNNYEADPSIGNVMMSSLKKMIIPSILMIIFLCLTLPLSLELRNAGALFMGGETGLWKDTLGTIVPRLLYVDVNYWMIRLTKGFFLIITASALILVGWKHYKKQRNNENLFLGSLLLLLILILISTVVQHRLLGTLYLIERAVLFLFVIFNLILVFFVYELQKRDSTLKHLLSLFAIIVLMHFLYSFNLKYVYEWKDECETKQMIRDLEKTKYTQKGRFNITLGVPLALESGINYYRTSNGLYWLNQTMRTKEINYLNDYLYLRPQDISKYDSIEIIQEYPVTKNILARPKYPFTHSKVLLDTILSNIFNIEPATEYSPGIEIELDSTFIQKNNILSCKVSTSVKQPFSGNVFFIISLENKNGNYFWINERINDFYTSKNDLKKEAFFTAIVPKEIKDKDKLKVYIWNPNKQSFLLESMQVRWIHYSY